MRTKLLAVLVLLMLQLSAVFAFPFERPGSALIFPLFTSNSSNLAAENTKISITNTNTTDYLLVKCVYIYKDSEGASECKPFSAELNMSPNKTTSVYAGQMLPDKVGFVTCAVVDEDGNLKASDSLVGQAWFKRSSGEKGLYNPLIYFANFSGTIPNEGKLKLGSDYLPAAPDRNYLSNFPAVNGNTPRLYFGSSIHPSAASPADDIFTGSQANVTNFFAITETNEDEVLFSDASEKSCWDIFYFNESSSYSFGTVGTYSAWLNINSDNNSSFFGKLPGAIFSNFDPNASISSNAFTYAYETHRSNDSFHMYAPFPCTVYAGESMTLDGDVSCDQGGVSITGDNVVLDCDNHIIEGSGADAIGIDLSGRSNVTIKNCIVQNWHHGILLNGTTGSLLLNNTLINNTDAVDFFAAGIYVGSSTDNTLLNNTAYGNKVGIFLTDSDGNVISQNQLASNIGNLRLQDGSDNNTMTFNALSNSGDAQTYLLSGSGNYYAYNNLSYSQNVGLFVAFESNDTIIGNDIYGNPAIPFLLQLVSASTVTDNLAHDNFGHGIELQSSSGNTLSGNQVYNNTGSGLSASTSDSNMLTSNLAFNNLQHGFDFQSSALNTFEDNTAFNNSGDGFILQSGLIITSFNDLSNNTAYNNSQNGFHLLKEDNNTLYNNTAFNNSANGFFLEGGTGGLIETSSGPSIASLAGPAEIASLAIGPPPPSSTDGADDNNLSGNSAYDNSLNGFYLFTSSHNLLSNNTASGNGRDGFLVEDAALGGGGAFCGNFICELGESQFNCPSDCPIIIACNFNQLCEFGEDPFNCPDCTFIPNSHNSLTGNNASDNDDNGFQIHRSDNNTLLNNTASGNGQAGFMLDEAPDTVFVQNLAYGNAFGFYETGANVSAAKIVNSHFYNNGWEITEIGPSLILLDGNPGFQIINSKLGNSSVNISLSDELLGGGYQINDTIAPGQAPSGLVPFHSKYLKVNYTRELDVDLLAFHWSDAEASPFDEQAIRIYTWNGTGWVLTPSQATNATTNTANAAGLTNITSDDIYGLFTTLGDDGGGQNPPPPPPPPPPPECTSDSQCAVSEQCISGTCQGIPCDCGAYQNHQCVEYQCCSDSDCPSGEICVGNSCQQEDQPECTSDLQCKDTQFCNIPPGQNGGSCKDLCPDGSSFCECSEAKGHKLVATGWACGSELGCAACPPGLQCLNHSCVSYNLTGPETVFINGSATIHAANGTSPCMSCDILITDPAGKNLTGRTDSLGNLTFPTPLKGAYKVTLLINGVPVKSITINALSKPEPIEPPKPAVRSPFEEFPWWLLILMLILILGIIYSRRRKEKRTK